MVMVKQLFLLIPMQQQTLKRDGNITFTGATRFMSGRRASEDSDSVFTNQQGSRLGSGDVSIFSNVTIQRDSANITNPIHVSKRNNIIF